MGRAWTPLLPIGYFISRLAASKAASTGQVTTTPDLLKAFVKPSLIKHLKQQDSFQNENRGGRKDIFDDIAIFAVFNAITFWSGNRPWDRFTMGKLDGYYIDPYVEYVAFKDAPILSDWPARQGRVSRTEAVLDDLGSLADAANLIFEMPDNLKDKYPFTPRIILFGHTHEAAFEQESPDTGAIYANTGTWIDSKPMTWAEIQITAPDPAQKLYEVSLWYYGEETPRQTGMITVTTAGGKPCTMRSCRISEYAQLLKKKRNK